MPIRKVYINHFKPCIFYLWGILLLVINYKHCAGPIGTTLGKTYFRLRILCIRLKMNTYPVIQRYSCPTLRWFDLSMQR